MQLFPEPKSDEAAGELPRRAQGYLGEAIRAMNGGAPAAAIMACASAVDSMLKEKGFRTGSLYARIDEAAKKLVITGDMATWAHQVRLDANDQRHADEEAEIPAKPDAERCIKFVETLGEILFVLPTRVSRGIEDASKGGAAG